MPFRERIKTFLFDKENEETFDFIPKWRDLKNRFKSHWSENHWSLRARIKHIASFSHSHETEKVLEEESGIEVEDELGNDDWVVLAQPGTKNNHAI